MRGQEAGGGARGQEAGKGGRWDTPDVLAGITSLAIAELLHSRHEIDRSAPLSKVHTCFQERT